MNIVIGWTLAGVLTGSLISFLIALYKLLKMKRFNQLLQKEVDQNGNEKECGGQKPTTSKLSRVWDRFRRREPGRAGTGYDGRGGEPGRGNAEPRQREEQRIKSDARKYSIEGTIGGSNRNRTGKEAPGKQRSFQAGTFDSIEKDDNSIELSEPTDI